jgi:DsbC/DsbD-like thiol-disulfide interchange protein
MPMCMGGSRIDRMTMLAHWSRALGAGMGGLAVAGLVAGLSAVGARAGDFNHSEARLLQGEFADRIWSAGVEIELSEGWKTYWRMPGEAGIAPVFDWTGSDNVAEVELRWPAPGRYHDASGETIGYAQRVVFPISVRPLDPSQPVDLVLELSYAVCKDICIPARVELRQVFDVATAMSSPAAALIRRFEALVPQRQTPGVELESAYLLEIAGAPRLAVTLIGEAVDPSTDIFVENFDGAYFRAPEKVGRSGNATLFHLAIDGLGDPDVLTGETLQLTVVTGTARLVGDVTVD